ncbi:MAG: helix-turn-helix domain-containing protein [Clostridia bacterium]|nr:helix-turn-helix domain-containing protein [Clostridia bacterium]
MITNPNEREINNMLSDISRNLPANLRMLRLSEGLSQEELSELLQMSRTSYNRIEKGRKYPDLLTVCVILRTFGIPLESLLNESLKDHV